MIISLKVAFRDFLHNMYTEVARAHSCTNRVQTHRALITCDSVQRATWYEVTAQLLSLAELKSNSFELYFVGRKHLPMTFHSFIETF